MILISRRSLLASALIVGLAPTSALFAADKPSQITIDWATYNPVSMVLKDKGLLEKEFAKEGIAIRWVQTLGSNKALEFLNAGSIDFGSTAGSAALVARKDTPIKSIAKPGASRAPRSGGRLTDAQLPGPSPRAGESARGVVLTRMSHSLSSPGGREIAEPGDPA